MAKGNGKSLASGIQKLATPAEDDESELPPAGDAPATTMPEHPAQPA